MQVNISGHQLDVTDALRDYVGEKLSRLERHFDKITNVQVIMEGRETEAEDRSHSAHRRWRDRSQCGT